MVGLLTGSKNQNLLVIIISECAFTVTQPFGVITSPGFPQLYQNWLDCTWNIQLPIGQLIQLNFLHFKVEDIVDDEFDDGEDCE